MFKNKSRKHDDISPVCQVIFRELSVLYLLKINSSYNEEENQKQCWPRAVILKRVYRILIWSLRHVTALDWLEQLSDDDPRRFHYLCSCAKVVSLNC